MVLPGGVALQFYELGRSDGTSFSVGDSSKKYGARQGGFGKATALRLGGRVFGREETRGVHTALLTDQRQANGQFRRESGWRLDPDAAQSARELAQLLKVPLFENAVHGPARGALMTCQQTIDVSRKALGLVAGFSRHLGATLRSVAFKQSYNLQFVTNLLPTTTTNRPHYNGSGGCDVANRTAAGDFARKG